MDKPGQEDSDAELLRGYVAEGRDGAFRALVERHADMVFSVALRRAGQWEIAEEAAQNVFRALAEKAAGLDKDVVLAGWLHKAALFEAATLQRAETTRARKMNDAADALAGDLEPDASPDPEAWAELSPYIDNALDQMPPGDRDVVLLRFYQDLTYREIGDRLGKNESAARKHTLRALEALSSLLKTREVTLPSTALGAGIAFGLSGAAPPAFGKTLAASIALPSAQAAAAATGGASVSVSLVATAALMFAAVQWHQHHQAGSVSAHDSAGGDSSSARMPSAMLAGNKKNTERPLDLDSVFAARGSERLRLLALWLPDAEPAQVRAAASRLKMENDTSSTGFTAMPNHNVDLAWGAIFARWAELDPGELVAYAVGARDPRYPWAKDNMLIQRAFLAWAHIDPAAALAGAAGHGSDVRAMVIGTFHFTDPEAVIEAAAGLDAFHRRHWMDWSALFKTLAQRDLATAAARASEITDSVNQTKAFEGVLSVWAAKDPQGALTYAEGLESFAARANGRKFVIETVLASDPAAALTMITALPTSVSRSELMRDFAIDYAGRNTDGVKAWADSLTSITDRRSAYAGIALKFSKTDPQAAVEALDALNWDLSEAGGSITYEPRGSGGGPGGSLATAAQTALAQLSESDPHSALRYAAKIVPSHRDILGGIARRYASEDPTAAMAFASELEPGVLRNEFAVQVANVLSASDPRAAMTWALGMGGHAGDRAQLAVFNTLASADPSSAAESITELPDVPQRKSAVRFLASTWLERDFEGARGWVQEHPDLDSIAPAVRPFLESWSERDALAASEWVAELPEGPAMQQAAVGLVGWMINQSDLDHEAAFAWTERITGERSSREFYFEIIAKDWLEHDPAAARDAVAATDLPEHIKARLLAAHRDGRAETSQ